MLSLIKRILTAPVTKRLTKTIRRNPFSVSAKPRYRPTIEALEDRSVPATLVTDKPDYAVGDTAYFYAAGFQVGETVQFQVLNTTPVRPTSPSTSRMGALPTSTDRRTARSKRRGRWTAPPPAPRCR